MSTLEESGSHLGQTLYQNAKKIIPGGTQLLGKRAEMYLPELWPAYYSRAKGVKIWDLDGREYLDCTMVGIGTSVLGYADTDVCDATIRALQSGNLTTLNAPEEVELAELLISLHPWAEMVRYARSGGEMMSVAIRVARAATGREKIAFCGYHGWHDWYLSANLSEQQALDGHLLPGLEPLGVPRGLRGTLLPFRYNNLADIQAIVQEHGTDLAAIVMEPCREEGPHDDYLAKVRQLADQCGAVLIFDEITSGWRMATSGMHRIYGVDPDLATFGKTISNGVPMAALIGKASIMNAVQKTFISSTYWTDRMGPTASLACLKKHQRLNVGDYLTKVGTEVQQGWLHAAQSHGLAITVAGIPPLASFRLEIEHWEVALTFFIQEMLARDILASDRFYANLCHDELSIKRYLQACGEIFGEIKAMMVRGDPIAHRLKGPVKHMGFKRLTS